MAREESRDLDDLTLARAQRGEPAAFARLVETFQDPVFAVLWRVLGRPAEAAVVEDLAQETFLAVYRALPRFTRSGAARLSTWILTIAVRAALRAKRAWRAQGPSVDDLAEVLPGPHTTDAPLERRAFGKALGDALDRLPAEYRAVFVLREYHDFDYAEIGRALDVDLGTVKSRLSRARARLRVELSEYEP